MHKVALLVISLLGLSATSLSAVDLKKLGDEDFAKLHALLQPQPGEAPWREVAWETDITAARERAVKEDKPLLIFTAADGSPLSRT